MNKEKNVLFAKCLLTGLLYAVITCIIQVPVANALLSLFDLQSDTSISNDMLLLLLLSLFVVAAVLIITLLLAASKIESVTLVKPLFCITSPEPLLYRFESVIFTSPVA